jgi:hypothetical protein
MHGFWHLFGGHVLSTALVYPYWPFLSLVWGLPPR